MMTTRRFNVDRYLDGQPQPEPLAPRFRRWASRANDRAEELLDTIDWRALDIKLGTFCGYALTGIGLYLGVKIADAIVAGWLR